jgi:hypothetical protein
MLPRFLRLWPYTFSSSSEPLWPMIGCVW